MIAIIISIVSSVAAAMLVFALQSAIKENRSLKKQKADREKALAEGMVCVLRKHLMDEHEKWMEKKYITSTALENGLAMYHAYKGLGGNGMIDHMNDDISELPVKD